MDKKIVIGHKSPDLDSVAAAVSYAWFKNQLAGNDEYEAAMAGPANKETEFAFAKFGLALPAAKADVSGLTLVLVDHNEASQSADGISEAKVIEVLDHHKVVFSGSEPIEIRVLPWGSTCSVIAHLAKERGLAIPPALAGVMLSALLVDTVIGKSPTCTPIDMQMASYLAEAAAVADWRAYGLELFKVRSSVSEMPVADIIKSDFKDFELKSGKFGIGQVETVDLSEFDGRHEEILAALDSLRQAGSYHSAILFITDIMKEGSLFLVSSADEAALAAAMGAEFSGHSAYIPGILSRKKQVAPKISEAFDK
jgi:manganese-dependent inorganic pyrophosphatase